MEQINHEVRQIETNLHSSRQELHTLENHAQKAISLEVDGIKTLLKKTDNRIENVSSQIQSFKAQIEYVDNAETSVDMDLQMTWLRDNLDKIIEELEEAHSNAHSAIECTNTYVYKVLDIKQDVESRSNKLIAHNDCAAALLTQAISAVSASERKLQSTQERISAKEREISAKNATATSKRQNKADLERQCTAKRRQIAEARRRQEDRRDQAIASTGLAVLGIIAAPFTAGASLVLTGAGAAGATYKACRMDEFEKEANNLQSSVNTLNTEILANTQAVARLELEKLELQSQIKSHRDEVSRRKEELEDLERQIEAINRTKHNITTLQEHAASTTSNVKNVLPELRGIKDNLEQCSVLVKDKSLDISTSQTSTERMVGRLPVVGNNLKRGSMFKKQMLVIQQVCDTLDQVHAEVPKLLSSQSSKFLDTKSWNFDGTSVSGLDDRVKFYPNARRPKSRFVIDPWLEM